MLYSAPQLRLLIGLALTLAVGLGVREWRAGFPGVAERFERFDRAEPALGTEPRPLESAPGSASGDPPAPATGGPVPGPIPAPAPAEPLDVNRADAITLARLPGVGTGLAQRIVEERERRGRFESPDELRYVLGMGPKKLAAIRPFIAVRD